MTEEQNAGKILLFCKEPSPEQIMKCLRDAFDVPGSVHDADLKLHNGDLDVTIRVYCESAGGEEQELVRGWSDRSRGHFSRVETAAVDVKTNLLYQLEGTESIVSVDYTFEGEESEFLTEEEESAKRNMEQTLFGVLSTLRAVMAFRGEKRGFYCLDASGMEKLILDGNGRWAKKRGLPRQLGHKKGCETLEQVVEDAARLGIRYLTVYGFSTENWKRPEEEVGALMQLFRFYAKRLLAMAEKNNIRVRMIGERNRFAPDIVEAINGLEEKTKENTGMTFVIAVNYGSRDEITRAVRKIMADCKDGKIAPEEMTEQVFASYLDTAGIPDPDLMIRTSGELRLSNFLLWQLAYSEFYFTDVPWPDFHKEELERAIEAYNKRDRRFGGLTDKK